jgi:hypothetical protein
MADVNPVVENVPHEMRQSMLHTRVTSPQPKPDWSPEFEHVADAAQLKKLPPDAPQYSHDSPLVYSGVSFSSIPSQL